MDARAFVDFVAASLADGSAPEAARFAFAFEGGARFVIDPSAASPVHEQWDEAAAVRVFTNERTVTDMLLGRFNASDPADDHIFLWTGEDAALDSLRRAIKGGRSVIDARAGGTR